MENEKEIIDSLVVGGVVGAALGALISNNKERGITIGTIAGAALFATFNAHEKAKRSNLRLVYEEDGIIYEEQNGVKKVLRKIEKPKISVKNRYKLK
jgi:hypothetical protein